MEKDSETTGSKEKNHVLVVRMPNDLYEILRGLSYHSRKSMSQLIRECLLEANLQERLDTVRG